MNKIKRALISVHNKIGIAQFAKELANLGIEILSTGGTAKLLQKEGVKVKAYDPAAMPKARQVLGVNVKFCKDAYEVARTSDCLIVATEWNEFKELDFRKIKRLMRQAVIVDGRNIYDPSEMRRLGFKYIGMGRR